MADSVHHSPEEQEEFAKTREHEYQDPHYHDEDSDITNDEGVWHTTKMPTAKKRVTRRPPPRRWYGDD